MPRLPVPPTSGDRIRNLNLIKLLVGAGWDVHAFAAVEDAPRADELRALGVGVDVAPLPPKVVRQAVVAAAVARGRAFQSRYYYGRSAQARAATLAASRHFDAVVCSQLFMAPYVPPALWSKTVFETQNVDAARVARMAETGGAKGLVARVQLPSVRAYEAAVAARAHTVSSASASDAEFFARLPGVRRSIVVPNGVDVGEWPARAGGARDREVLYVGSLDYGANVDAALQLVNEIMPRLESPARLTIVGAHPPRALRLAAERASFPVAVTGFVADVAPYFERSRVLAVPLRSGGGTRLKILEALARELPVVSTAVGCEGIDVVPSRDLLVADDAAEFARALDRVLGDDGLAARLAAAGADVARAYDWRRIGGPLVEALDRIAAGPEREVI